MAVFIVKISQRFERQSDSVAVAEAVAFCRKALAEADPRGGVSISIDKLDNEGTDQ